MAVRSSMASLIASVRQLINDPAGGSQIFDDQSIQDVFDESRVDFKNARLIPKPTFSGSTIQYLDYWSDWGGWEDGYLLKQYLVTTVTPSVLEPIAGHWTFAATMLPPVYISGSLHDRYRAAADMLERWAARYMTRFDFTSDAQSFRVSQVPTQLQALAKTYRAKQRLSALSVVRSDLGGEQSAVIGLGPTIIDYMTSG